MAKKRKQKCSNPESKSVPAQIRRLPSGEIQLKLSLKGKGAEVQAQAIRKALGKLVKSAVITGAKNPGYPSYWDYKLYDAKNVIRRSARKVGLKRVLKKRNSARRRKR